MFNDVNFIPVNSLIPYNNRYFYQAKHNLDGGDSFVHEVCTENIFGIFLLKKKRLIS